jgi:hypothetical protein
LFPVPNLKNMSGMLKGSDSFVPAFLQASPSETLELRKVGFTVMGARHEGREAA